MKKIYWRTVNGAVNMKNRVGEILKGEEGMGTVEVILIILGIFTPYYGVGIRCMA